MDRYRLYFSNNSKDIIKFYNSFGKPEELFDFLSQMPKESVKTTILRNDDRIVIVVPTADINNGNAKRIKNVYKDYTIILVESRGKFFNFSYSMNVGIEKAISLNPGWIIITNDDVYPQNTNNLTEKLEKINKDIIIPKKIQYEKSEVTTEINIYKSSRFLNLLYRIAPLSNLFPIYLKGRFLCNSINYYKNMLKYLNINADSYFNRLFFVGKKIVSVYNIQPVSIIRAKVLRDFKFDQIFQNGGEDLDLSLRLKKAGLSFYPLDLVYLGQTGSTLGINYVRLYRNTLVEILYISYKIYNHMYE